MKHIKINKMVMYLMINILLFTVNMYFALQPNSTSKIMSILACIFSVIAIILYTIMIFNNKK